MNDINNSLIQFLSKCDHLKMITKDIQKDYKKNNLTNKKIIVDELQKNHIIINDLIQNQTTLWIKNTK
jgi:hypothetical protein